MHGQPSLGAALALVAKPSKTAHRLATLVRRLRSYHGSPVAPPMRDPYLLLLWEQVGYLADDEKRLAAYSLLQSSVGTRPRDIIDATTPKLQAVTRTGGGVAVAERAERLRTIAKRVLGEWDGDLRAVLALPLQEARRELTRFPSIGEAGAERILLLCGAHAVLALDSNALRVLTRSDTAASIPIGQRHIVRLKRQRMLNSPERRSRGGTRFSCCASTARPSAAAQRRAVSSVRCVPIARPV